jgi:hypothetical protein
VNTVLKEDLCIIGLNYQNVYLEAFSILEVILASFTWYNIHWYMKKYIRKKIVLLVVGSLLFALILFSQLPLSFGSFGLRPNLDDCVGIALNRKVVQTLFIHTEFQFVLGLRKYVYLVDPKKIANTNEAYYCLGHSITYQESK